VILAKERKKNEQVIGWLGNLVCISFGPGFYISVYYPERLSHPDGKFPVLGAVGNCSHRQHVYHFSSMAGK
jgi:hypothetical protein